MSKRKPKIIVAVAPEPPAKVDRADLLAVQLSQAKAQIARLEAELEAARFQVRYSYGPEDRIADDLTIVRARRSRAAATAPHGGLAPTNGAPAEAVKEVT